MYVWMIMSPCGGKLDLFSLQASFLVLSIKLSYDLVSTVYVICTFYLIIFFFFLLCL